MQTNLATLQAENTQLVKNDTLMTERWKLEKAEMENNFKKKEQELLQRIELKDKELENLKH